MKLVVGSPTPSWRSAITAALLLALLAFAAAGAGDAQAQGPYLVRAWGLNLSGQLGDGSEDGPDECVLNSQLEAPCSTNPVEVGDLGGATALAAGEEFSLALLESGSVEAWGENESGQLGDGVSGEEQPESDLPVPVSGLSGATAIAAGGSHGLALLANGTVRAWGGGESGALGNRKKEDSDVPVTVSGLNGAIAVAAGEEHSLALLSGGTVVSWGYNGSGQLGEGTKNKRTKPVAVSGLSGVVGLAAGEEHSVALLAGGTVMAWGNNEAGQLGDASAGGPTNCGTKKAPVPCSKTPVAVNGLSGVTAVAAGGDHTLALLSNGTVMAWGENAAGELGDGTTANSDVPVAVSGLSGVVAIAAGEEDSLALLEDGDVVAWGANEVAELGLGAASGPEECGPAQHEQSCSTLPREVSGLTAAKGIAAGGEHNLVLVAESAQRPATHLAQLDASSPGATASRPARVASPMRRRERRLQRRMLRAARAGR